MAIKTYLYRGRPDLSRLDDLLAIGANPVIGSVLGPSMVPITIDDTHKADLDEAMQELGYVFVAEYTSAPALSGRQDYGVFASDPTGVPVNDGDAYYNSTLGLNMVYDGARAKWLSVESVVFAFGRDGVTVANQFFRGADGRVQSALIGWNAPYDGTVVGLSYTRGNISAMAFEITAGGSAIASLTSATLKGKSTSLDADFSADDVIGIRNAAGGNPAENVSGLVRVRWRSP